MASASRVVSRFHGQPHLTARQYARIVHGWIEGAGMDSSAYGTHSIRRTKALIAPHSWRLPFEGEWRDPNVMGA